MMMVDRSYLSPSGGAGRGYRFGFNGKENDNRVKGEGNSLDFGARIYDPRIGRFLSTDPKTMKFPDLTPYNFAVNSPIMLIDKEGTEPDRNQAGILGQATAQWSKLKNQTVDGILTYLQTDPNAVRYIYTKDKGWIDLQHYFGTLKYGETAMDLLEPVNGSKPLQSSVFGTGANESYFSYEDLPTNEFAGEIRTKILNYHVSIVEPDRSDFKSELGNCNSCVVATPATGNDESKKLR